jgi:hypothetical protein
MIIRLYSNLPTPDVRITFLLASALDCALEYAFDFIC